MSALSTLELDLLGRQLLGARYLGTFARDELPNMVKQPRPFGLIFNTDPAGTVGTHWLAIYADAHTTDFFDSYGLPPSFYGFDTSLFRSTTNSVQSLGSAVCGHYCLLFLYYRTHGHSFESSISSLQNKYTDASAARMISSLTRYSDRNRHPQCKGQTCSNKCRQIYIE